MKYLILTYILIFLFSDAFACSCAPIMDLEERQERAYKENDLIFVGMVISENKEEKTYTMKIIELLSGDYQESLVVGQVFPYGCSLWPEKGIPWLVYTNLARDKTINIQECSLSRSFEFPYLMHESATVPPPTSKSIDYDKQPVEWMLDLAIRETAYRRKALEVMQKEIEKVRNGY